MPAHPKMEYIKPPRSLQQLNSKLHLDIEVVLIGVYWVQVMNGIRF